MQCDKAAARCVAHSEVRRQRRRYRSRVFAGHSSAPPTAHLIARALLFGGGPFASPY